MNNDLLSELESDLGSLPEDGKLKQLEEQIVKMVSLERAIDQFEELLKETKEHLTHVSDKVIPDLMDEAGLAEFTTKSGFKVVVKPFYNGKITTENEGECFQWLEQSGNSGLIKHNVEVKLGRSEHELATKITAYLAGLGVDYSDKESVHWATLNAFIKEQITKGHAFPMELFNVFIGRTTKLKRV